MSLSPEKSGPYVVVARRYRPQGFDDLVGQNMVSQALRNAIATDRVGHAYLFTGARGVGKTSTARILSKALNCEQGPSPQPCHECDICQSIAAGDDVDVLEIDGSHNRGIDEIRQLRSNISVRPSRSRYKIYIIDEVHMLTKEAFNALLKTLEEPPGHVKFIFCTTDPEKIPITVLSRCQRFDFSPVSGQEIVDRLKFIVESEGAEADEEALRILARKAGGSVRDSQSLLEQLMSFTSERITLEAVNQMLGTAGTQRLHGVMRALANQDACEALRELDQAIGEGVDAGQLAEQLLGCTRDLLALSVGGDKELLLHSAESEAEELAAIANAWGTPNLLAASQILDEALARMRLVTHARVLVEMALIRIAKLEDLSNLSELITQLNSGEQPTGGARMKAVKKKAATKGPVADLPSTRRLDHEHSVIAGPAKRDAAPAAAPASTAGQTEELGSQAKQSITSSERNDAQIKDLSDPPVLEPASLALSGEEIWRRTLAELDGLTKDFASHFAHAANSAPNRLVVTFPAMYTSSKTFCERPEKQREMERIASEIAGSRLKLEFRAQAAEAGDVAGRPRRAVTARQRERDALQNPFVQRALEVFSGDVTSVSPPPKQPKQK